MKKSIQKKSEVFVVAAEEKRNFSFARVFYVVIAISIVVFIVTLLISTNSSSEEESGHVAPVIEEAKKVIEEKALSQENTEAVLDETSKNVSEVEPTVATPEQLPFVPEVQSTLKTLEVQTNSNLWIGIRETVTSKYKNLTIKNDYSIDPNVNQVVDFGHGQFKLLADGEELKIEKPWYSQRLIIKDGVIESFTYVTNSKETKTTDNETATQAQKEDEAIESEEGQPSEATNENATVQE